MTDTTSTRPQMGDEELIAELWSAWRAWQSKGYADGSGVLFRQAAEALTVRASLPQPTAQSTVHDEGHPHLIGGEFQSDKYPTTPRGKVPLSVKDKTAQDLLWTYAQRRRAVDSEFANDLELALTKHGFVPSTPAQSVLVEAERNRLADILWARGMTYQNLRKRSGWLLASTVVRRGRELAEQEKLDNLFRAIDEIEDEPESAPSQPAPVAAPSMTDLMVTPESIDLHLLREACDWPQDLTFKFLDEPGEHDPCYVIMPGGAMLAFAHHDKNGVDQARAQFIVDACNEKIASNG